MVLMLLWELYWALICFHFHFEKEEKTIKNEREGINKNKHHSLARFNFLSRPP